MCQGKKSIDTRPKLPIVEETSKQLRLEGKKVTGSKNIGEKEIRTSSFYLKLIVKTIITNECFDQICLPY